MLLNILFADDVQFKIKGAAEFGPQYHFTMEGQTALCVPSEDGVDIYAATQWITLVQESVATVLGFPQNRYLRKIYAQSYCASEFFLFRWVPLQRVVP